MLKEADDHTVQPKLLRAEHGTEACHLDQNYGHWSIPKLVAETLMNNVKAGHSASMFRPLVTYKAEIIEFACL